MMIACKGCADLFKNVTEAKYSEVCTICLIKVGDEIEKDLARFAREIIEESSKKIDQAVNDICSLIKIRKEDEKDIKEYIARKNAELREVERKLVEVKCKDYEEDSFKLLKAFAAGAFIYFLVSNFSSIAFLFFRSFLYHRCG